MKSIFNDVARLVTRDVRQQWFCPTKGVINSVMTNIWSKSSKPVISAVVRHLDVQPDSNVLEIGFGRGIGLELVLKKVFEGSGSVCGVELSRHMKELAEESFLEMFEDEPITQRKVVLYETGRLGLLPFTSNYFEGIFHVDVFYGWNPKVMDALCYEMFRTLKPGHPVICGMELKRLRKYASYGFIDEREIDPVRYLEFLERVGFKDIRVVYEKIDENGDPLPSSSSGRNEREIQLIFARKPADRHFVDPDAILASLEEDVKRERALKEIQTGAKARTQKMAEELEEERMEDEKGERDREVPKKAKM